MPSKNIALAENRLPAPVVNDISTRLLGAVFHTTHSTEMGMLLDASTDLMAGKATAGVLDARKLCDAVAAAGAALACENPVERLMACDAALAVLEDPLTTLLSEESEKKGHRLYERLSLGLKGSAAAGGLGLACFGALAMTGVGAFAVAGGVLIGQILVSLPVALSTMNAQAALMEGKAKRLTLAAAGDLVHRLQTEKQALLENLSIRDAGAAGDLDAVLDKFPALEERFNREARRQLIRDAAAAPAVPALPVKKSPPV
jgi:hypothetical protein